MRRKILIGILVAVMAMSMMGCSSNEGKDTIGTDKQDVASDNKQDETEEEEKTTAVSMRTTGNPAEIELNNSEGILDPKKGSSWVKIATIWDENLTIYDADSFEADSVALAVTFDVSGLDKEMQKCYWNYQVLDKEGNEVMCWDESYKTDDIEITEDGTYQMVYDYKEVTDDGIIHGLESLQLVFPEIEKTTTTKVTVKEAVCITDADEIGTVYKSGKVE